MSYFSTFSVQMTRAELGLAPLDLNDQANYIVSNTIMGGAQSWNRQTVKSPYVDGEYTVHRSLSQVHEQFDVQVLGATQTALQNNITTLTNTVSQFRFQLTIVMNETSRTWQCETADYTVDWSQERWMAMKVLVHLQIPRLPGLVTT